MTREENAARMRMARATTRLAARKVYVHPTTARMDAQAADPAWWAKFECRPSAADLYAARVAPLGRLRVVTL